MRLMNKIVAMALLVSAPASYAGVIITSVNITPNPLGANSVATITVNGFHKAAAPGQLDCPGVEIFFDDVPNVSLSSQSKPANAFVLLQPASFPVSVTHTYAKAGSYSVFASRMRQFNGKWVSCAAGTMANLEVISDTIQSIKSISPAVANQSTSVVVKGLGHCNQNLLVNWGDGSSSTLPGPVDLQAGGIASHVYTSPGTRTVVAQGSGCNGQVSTNISVALLANPTQGGADPMARQSLRERLDRFALLPPAPVQGRNPACPVCDGLAQQIATLDQSGRALQNQSSAYLGPKGGMAAPKTLAPAADAGELSRKLDGYYSQRSQLLHQYNQALAQAQTVKPVKTGAAPAMQAAPGLQPLAPVNELPATGKRLEKPLLITPAQ